VLSSDLAQRPELADTGGEQDVQAPDLLLDGAVQPIEIREGGNVAADARRVVGNLIHRRLERRLPAPRNDDPRALDCQPLCRGEPEAGRTAGDESHLSVMFARVRILKVH